MSKNAEGWVRHRGGKCPVDAGVKVDYRMRNGRLGINERSELLDWARSDESPKSDIMAYKLHKPAEQAEACSKPDQRDSAKRDSDYVCWMRDRITEIDSTTQALTAERAELVQKLASEGFALIGRVVEPVEDMSDWRNWKVGDLIECTNDSPGGSYKNGEIHEIEYISDDRVGTVTDSYGSTGNDWGARYFKFHSRPSA